MKAPTASGSGQGWHKFKSPPSSYEQPIDALRLIYAKSSAIGPDIEAQLSADFETGNLYLIRTDVPTECLTASGTTEQPEGPMPPDSRQ
jgi:hypothetical protein